MIGGGWITYLLVQLRGDGGKGLSEISAPGVDDDGAGRPHTRAVKRVGAGIFDRVGEEVNLLALGSFGVELGVAAGGDAPSGREADAGAAVGE